MVSGSVSWAKLEPDGERKVTEFIDSLDECEGEQVSIYMYVTDPLSSSDYIYTHPIPHNLPIIKTLQLITR